MKTKYLTIILGLAVFAIPAVSASQPANVKLSDLAPATSAAPVTSDLAQLLADPYQTGELSIELPTRYTTFEWINEDPFKG